MTGRARPASALAGLRPDIDVTRRAIERVVASLSNDPVEQEAIITAAAAEAVTTLCQPI